MSTAWKWSPNESDVPANDRVVHQHFAFVISSLLVDWTVAQSIHVLLHGIKLRRQVVQ